VIQTDQLSFVRKGRRIEFRFRGVLVASGLAKDSHMMECIGNIRRALGGGKFADGSYEQAQAIWDARVEWRSWEDHA
jgi:hypothetical protein